MNELTALVGIVASITIGAISPGPSFIMVARTAIGSSRGEGLAAAVGMGLAGTILSIAALAGLNSLLLAMPSLYLVLKVVGGLYLVYIGVRIWAGAVSRSIGRHLMQARCPQQAPGNGLQLRGSCANHAPANQSGRGDA